MQLRTNKRNNGAQPRLVVIPCHFRLPCRYRNNVPALRYQTVGPYRLAGYRAYPVVEEEVAKELTLIA